MPSDDALYEQQVTFYLGLSAQALDAAFGAERATWMNRLEQEYQNLSAVLDALVKHSDSARGLQLAYNLQELWFEDAHTADGRVWFDKLLALPYSSDGLEQRAMAFDLAGALALNEGDLDAAADLKTQGLAIVRGLNNPVRTGYALIHLGHLKGYAQGDYAAARTLYQEALDLLQNAQNREGITHVQANLGTVLIMLDDYETARPLIRASLQSYRELEFTYDVALSIRRAAGITAGMQHPENALRLAGAGAAHFAATGVSHPAYLENGYQRMIESARAALNASSQAALWHEGETLTIEQAITLAMTEL